MPRTHASTHALTRALSKRLDLADRLAEVVAALTAGRKKPDPDPPNPSPAMATYLATIERHSHFQVPQKLVWALYDIVSEAGYDLPSMQKRVEAERAKAKEEATP